MTSLAATGLAIAGRLAATDLSIGPGQMVALAGPNGGGKTSLLRALAGVEGAKGRSLIGGVDVAPLSEARRRQLIAFVPASREVGWTIRVRDVIALGLGRLDEDRVQQLLALLELGPVADRPVTALSTGERARVLIGRALAARPRLLLLDEPLSNLDPYWVLRLGEILRGVADAGTMVLVALHDLSQLSKFDRALLIADGRVQHDDKPARIMESEAFERIFRIRADGAGWAIRPEDRRSSP